MPILAALSLRRAFPEITCPESIGELSSNQLYHYGNNLYKRYSVTSANDVGVRWVCNYGICRQSQRLCMHTSDVIIVILCLSVKVPSILKETIKT